MGLISLWVSSLNPAEKWGLSVEVGTLSVVGRLVDRAVRRG